MPFCPRGMGGKEKGVDASLSASFSGQGKKGCLRLVYVFFAVFGPEVVCVFLYAVVEVTTAFGLMVVLKGAGPTTWQTNPPRDGHLHILFFSGFKVRIGTS